MFAKTNTSFKEHFPSSAYLHVSSSLRSFTTLVFTFIHTLTQCAPHMQIMRLTNYVNSLSCPEFQVRATLFVTLKIVYFQEILSIIS
jgi:hypothetical protein